VLHPAEALLFRRRHEASVGEEAAADSWK
jgi:hypothetical protein